MLIFLSARTCDVWSSKLFYFFVVHWGTIYCRSCVYHQKSQYIIIHYKNTLRHFFSKALELWVKMNITNRRALWDLGIHKIEVAQCTLNFTSQWLYLWRTRCPWRIERHEGRCIWNAQWILWLLFWTIVITVACKCNIDDVASAGGKKNVSDLSLVILLVDDVEGTMIRNLE